MFLSQRYDLGSGSRRDPDSDLPRAMILCILDMKYMYLRLICKDKTKRRMILRFIFSYSFQQEMCRYLMLYSTPNSRAPSSNIRYKRAYASSLLLFLSRMEGEGGEKAGISSPWEKKKTRNAL